MRDEVLQQVHVEVRELMNDNNMRKKMEELRQKLNKSVADPNGTCNSSHGACLECGLTDRCKIRPKKMKEDGIAPDPKGLFFIHNGIGNA